MNHLILCTQKNTLQVHHESSHLHHLHRMHMRSLPKEVHLAGRVVTFFGDFSISPEIIPCAETTTRCLRASCTNIVMCPENFVFVHHQQLEFHSSIFKGSRIGSKLFLEAKTTTRGLLASHTNIIMCPENFGLFHHSQLEFHSSIFKGLQLTQNNFWRPKLPLGASQHPSLIL